MAIFQDDFNRPNENIEASADWGIIGPSGNIAVRNNQLAFIGTGECLARPPDLGSPDQYAQIVRQTGTPNGFFDLVVRATDTNNFAAAVRFNSDRYQIYTRQSGSFSLQASSSLTASVSGAVWRLEAEGNVIRFFVNGVLRLGPLTITFNNTETRQGTLSRSNTRNPLGDLWESGTLGTSTVLVDASIDSAVLAGRASTAAVGVALQSPASASASLDGILRAQLVALSAVDAAALSTREVSHSLDAGLKRAGTLATALTGALQSGGATGVGLDSIISTTGGGTQPQIDAAMLRQAILSGLVVDGALVSTEGRTALADAALQSVAEAATSDIDATLLGIRGAATQLGAVLSAGGTSTAAALDAAASLSLDAASAMGAALRAPRADTPSMDVALVLTGLLSTALDSVLTDAATVAVALDSLLRQTGVSVSVGMDAILSGSLTMGCPTATVLLYTAVDGSIVLGPAACSAVQTQTH